MTPEHEIPALTELRESLREAARRDVVARAPRRRRRRALFVCLAVLLGGGAAAGAADLISSGKPVKGGYVQQQRYNRVGDLQLSVTSHDTPLPWGVAVYRSRAGQPCAVAGRVRGVTLGVLRAGQFHPYTADHPAACGRLDARHEHFQDMLRADGRTVFFGRVRPGARRAVAIVDGKRYALRIGVGGAWLLVFRGAPTLSEIDVS
jgi:hypothetical protein